MIFLREVGEVARKEGLGKHSFGRIPCVGEYISLNSEGLHLKVSQVHHTGFSSHHSAELYVIEATDMQMIGGEPHPPA
jgi:hypothetical protein